MTRHDDPQAASGATKRQRIAKLMARAGLCSRRDAEAWIVDGRVSVNGEVITSPALDVSDEDTILVDGSPIPTAEKTRLFLFHKPRGLVTSDHDPEGRETVADFLRQHWPEGPRVVTIGRLDINTEGLLLLTNDGGLARTLELPQTGWVRRYRVRAKGEANPAALEALAAGVTIDGIDYAGIEAKLDRVQGANCWLTMGLREGKNREVKRVLEHIGLEVNRLIRLSFGPFQLLDLPEGRVEEVRTRVLRDQLGENLAAQAGVDFGNSEPAPVPQRAKAKTSSERAKPPTRAKPLPSKPSSDRGSRPAGRMARPPTDRTTRAERRDDRDEGTPPVRERPVAGARKHVSTLRAAETEDARKGPRKRIERSDTQDRRERTIKVERLVSTQPPEKPRRPRASAADAGVRDPNTRFPRRPTRPEEGQRPARLATRERPREEARPHRDERMPRREDRPREGRAETRREGPAPRRHASPSAIGKRERMSRSGAPPERSQERRPTGDRRNEDSRSTGSIRPARDERRSRDERAPREERAPRQERGPGPGRAPRGERAQVARPGSERRQAADRDPGKRETRPDRERPRATGDKPRPRSANAPRRNEKASRAGDGKAPRRDDKAPRSGPRKPGSRPMGAASRKPGPRKSPSGTGGPPRGKPPRGPKR